MYLHYLLQKPDIAFRLRSIGLCLASPTNIRSWSFKLDSSKKPILGEIQNAKTVNYKTLLPEKGGLFCPTVFGQTREHQRHKLGYVSLVVPITHLWYLKSTPSYLALLLNKKRKHIQSVVYAQSCISFPKQNFSLNDDYLKKLYPSRSILTVNNINLLMDFKTFQARNKASLNHLITTPDNQFIRHFKFKKLAIDFNFNFFSEQKTDLQNLNVQNNYAQIHQICNPNLSPLLQTFYQTVGHSFVWFSQKTEPEASFAPPEKLNPALHSYYGNHKSQIKRQYQNYFWLIYAHKNFIKFVFSFNLTHQIKLYTTLQNLIWLSKKTTPITESIKTESKIIIDLLHITKNLKEVKFLTDNPFDNDNNQLFRQTFHKKIKPKLSKELKTKSTTLSQSGNDSNDTKWLESQWAKIYVNQESNKLKVYTKILNSKLKKFKLKGNINPSFFKQWLKNKKIRIKQWRQLKETYEFLFKVETVLLQLPSLNLLKWALNLEAFLKDQFFKISRQKTRTKLKKAHLNLNLNRGEKVKTILNALTYSLNKDLLCSYPFQDELFPINEVIIRKDVEIYGKHIGFYLPLANCYPYIPTWMLYTVNGNNFLTLKKQLLQYLKNYFINTDLNQLKWRSSSKSLSNWVKILNSKILANPLKQTRTNVELNNYLNSEELNKKLNNIPLKRNAISLLKFQYELKKGKFDEIAYFMNSTDLKSKTAVNSNYWFSSLALTNLSNPLLDTYNNFQLKTVLTYKKLNRFCLRTQIQLFEIPWYCILRQMLINKLKWDKNDQEAYEQLLKKDEEAFQKNNQNKRIHKRENQWIEQLHYNHFNEIRFYEYIKTRSLCSWNLDPFELLEIIKEEKKEERTQRRKNKGKPEKQTRRMKRYLEERDELEEKLKKLKKPEKLVIQEQVQFYREQQFKRALLEDSIRFFDVRQNGFEKRVTFQKLIQSKKISKKNLRKKWFQQNKENKEKRENKSFELNYIPLTYRYSQIPKAYEPPKVNKRLKNPLGHKNYRQFVKEKFALSVKKSICISQLKQYSKSLLFEKAASFKTADLQKQIKNFNLNVDFSFLEKQRLIYFVLTYLQTDFHIDIRSEDGIGTGIISIRTVSSKKIKKQKISTLWYKKLSQYQLHFLCPFKRFNYFNQPLQLCSLINVDFIFIQKAQTNYHFLKVRIPFTKSLNFEKIFWLEQTFGSKSLNKKSQKSKKAPTSPKFIAQKFKKGKKGFLTNLISGSNSNQKGYNTNKMIKRKGLKRLKGIEKQIVYLNHKSLLLNKKNYIKVDQLQKIYWTKELEMFKRLIKIKSRLNSLLSSINHKVNLFLLAFKPSLVLDIKEVLGFQFQSSWPLSSDSYMDVFQISAADAKPRFIRDEHKQRVRSYKQKVILKKFNLDFKQKSDKIVHECANYFSLKTKLIKAKSVRLLLAYRLLTRFSSASANLNQLLWNLNLKSKRFADQASPNISKNICLLELDCLLYNRLMLPKRSLPISPIKHCVGEVLTNFVQAKKIIRNTYYVVQKGFAWFFNSHYEVLNLYMNREPNPDDFILPAYVERSITFDRPITGSWAIRLLLDQFKPAKERLSQLQSKFVKLDNKDSLFYQYYRGAAMKLSNLNKKIRSFRNFRQNFMLSPFPDNPLYWVNPILDFGLPTKEQILFRQRRALRFHKRMINRINKKRNIISRRVKFLRPWIAPQTNPALMVLTLLPILPPELRPMLPLSGGQFAMADLNKLYQQVIYRNQRLAILGQDPGYSREYSFLGFGKLLRFNYRLMQEAVDALMDNGKSDSKVVLNNQNQPLKSLSEGLRGKRGRFRNNLLGKRVDYSGRSVIIVGPQLQVHQCGLPKEMALELFQPFLVQQLIQQNYANNFTFAKKLIKQKKPIIWKLLEQLMLNRPVLLNRAPTLHRLGIQAFQPLLVSGRAILLHPLVCSAFNADFDGDQMAVHVPLSYDACSEAWKLMWSRNNLFSLATGEPNLTPTQDMVLGCYYLSTLDQIKNKLALQNQNSTSWFGHLNQVLQTYNQNQIELHQMIWLKWSDKNRIEFDLDWQPCLEFQLNNKGHKRVYYTSYCQFYDHFYWIRTTVGRILLNQLIFDLES